jgi:DNA-binding NarL/FixJ family response regulator
MTDLTPKRLTIVAGQAGAGLRQRSVDVDASRFSYLIADDHPSTTLAVSQLLSEVVGLNPSRFATFTGSEELLATCAEPPHGIRLVVLDLVMPGTLKRAALVQALLRADPTARVLVYTAEESAFLARAVVDAGATGYVAKTSPAAELMDAIVAVSHGRRHVDSRIDLESVKTHPWASLTDAERAVLLAMCRGAKAPDIVSRTGRSYSTVTTHKYNGLNKLGLRDGSDLLPYLYMNGLLHELDGDPAPA